MWRCGLRERERVTYPSPFLPNISQQPTFGWDVDTEHLQTGPGGDYDLQRQRLLHLSQIQNSKCERSSLKAWLMFLLLLSSSYHTRAHSPVPHHLLSKMTQHFAPCSLSRSASFYSYYISLFLSLQSRLSLWVLAFLKVMLCICLPRAFVRVLVDASGHMST